MLSLTPNPERLRRADHLLPRADGVFASRPGAYQLVAGAVDRAVPWGNRVLLERQGRLWLWDGSTLTDLCPAGTLLQAAPFQALTKDAEREDRLYVADGVNPLWYVARRDGVWQRIWVWNTVLDANSDPYPIPNRNAPVAIEAWRERLWIAFGENRVQHCQARDPDRWSPLWTREFQSNRGPDRARALRGTGSELIVGSRYATHSVSGTSQYNFTDETIAESGILGPGAIDTDGTRVWYLSEDGLHERSAPSALLSEDLDIIFRAPQNGGQGVVEPRLGLLALFVHGRIFVAHTDRPNRFGELPVEAFGLLRLADGLGWSGPDGIWVLGAIDTPDRALDDSEAPVAVVWQTWPQRPNNEGRGTAKLQRTRFLVRGSHRANATYTATSVDAEGRSNSEQSALALSLDDGHRPDLRPAVRRELTPRLRGQTFVHRIESNVHIELVGFEPVYDFGERENV